MPVLVYWCTVLVHCTGALYCSQRPVVSEGVLHPGEGLVAVLEWHARARVLVHCTGALYCSRRPVVSEGVLHPGKGLVEVLQLHARARVLVHCTGALYRCT
eukprot:3786747-Pyramimonas_sp.AAC.1